MKKYAFISTLAFIVTGILFASDVENLCKNGWTTEASEIQMIMSFKPDGTALLDYKKGPKDEEEIYPTKSQNKTGVYFSSFSDSTMNEIGSGFVRLFIGEKTTLTLILIPTEMENRFHLCATITEAN